MKRLVYKLKVLGQPVTSEVRSSAKRDENPVIADNFASDGARVKFQRPTCSSRRVEQVSMFFLVPTDDFYGSIIRQKTSSGHMTSLAFDDPVVP